LKTVKLLRRISYDLKYPITGDSSQDGRRNVATIIIDKVATISLPVATRKSDGDYKTTKPSQ